MSTCNPDDGGSHVSILPVFDQRCCNYGVWQAYKTTDSDTVRSRPPTYSLGVFPQSGVHLAGSTMKWVSNKPDKSGYLEFLVEYDMAFTHLTVVDVIFALDSSAGERHELCLRTSSPVRFLCIVFVGSCASASNCIEGLKTVEGREFDVIRANHYNLRLSEHFYKSRSIPQVEIRQEGNNNTLSSRFMHSSFTTSLSRHWSGGSMTSWSSS